MRVLLAIRWRFRSVQYDSRQRGPCRAFTPPPERNPEIYQK
jgi:hypothetical protein